MRKSKNLPKKKKSVIIFYASFENPTIYKIYYYLSISKVSIKYNPSRLQTYGEGKYRTAFLISLIMLSAKNKSAHKKKKKKTVIDMNHKITFSKPSLYANLTDNT